MTKISDYTYGRNNNFNLIRLVAAYMVLFSHSFPLSSGRGYNDGLYHYLPGMSFGALAVDIFFFISGFLITQSLLRKQSIISYISARIRRVYPALIVVVCLTVFVLGPLISKFSISDYFAYTQTYDYLYANITVINKIQYFLPGVFEQVPYRNAVNGSLWTLRYEVRAYLLLGIIFFSLLILSKIVFKDREKITILFKCTMIFVTGILFTIYLNKAYSEIIDYQSVRLFSIFSIGSVICLFSDKIALNKWIAIVCIVILAGMAQTNYIYFTLCHWLLSGYIILYLAYIPSGFIRQFNRLGDYSYGVYIYAFPVQQSCMLFFSDFSPYQLFATASIIVMFFAVLSWHLIEKRCIVRLRK